MPRCPALSTVRLHKTKDATTHGQSQKQSTATKTIIIIIIFILERRMQNNVHHREQKFINVEYAIGGGVECKGVGVLCGEDDRANGTDKKSYPRAIDYQIRGSQHNQHRHRVMQ